MSETTSRRELGTSGEQRAAAWLEGQGWHILARNWRTRSGEIDLVAVDPDGVLVICEVKTRRGTGYGDPLEALTWAKTRRLRQLAGEFLLDQDQRWSRVRIDAIGVLVRGDGLASFRRVTVEP